MAKLYVVYDEDNFVYIVKAQNKKEAVNLAHSQYGLGNAKSRYVAKELEKELFRKDGADKQVVML